MKAKKRDWKRMSMQQLADKCEWEGGVTGAIAWGIRSNQVPLELEDDWKLAEDAFEVIDRLERILDDELYA